MSTLLRTLLSALLATGLSAPAWAETPIRIYTVNARIRNVGNVEFTIRVYCTPNKERTVFSLTDPLRYIFKNSPQVQPFAVPGCLNAVEAKQELEGIPFPELDDDSELSSASTASRQAARRPERDAVAGRSDEERHLYVAVNSPVETIEVVDMVTEAMLASINVSPRLFGGLEFSPDGERLYATLWRSTTATPPLPAQILILDTTTNQVLDRITLTGDMLPSAPAVSLDGKLLYFADGGTAGLVIVDLAAKAVAQTIPATAAGGAANRFHSLAISPDGGLICVTDNFGIALLDTRTRTFVGRVNISLPNRQMAPVFHPNGSKVYIIERRSVSGALAVWLVAIDTASLTEVGRVTLPGQFDPRNLVITPDGLSLAMDGFLRPAGQPAKAVFILVDTTTNTVVSTNEPEEPTVGALGVVLR